MAQNGRIPSSDLADIPGGRLTREAAASWLRLRARIGKETGVWICPTSQRTAYRPYADQEYFWRLYTSGRGSLAARPGTSNHGLGVAVDVPQPRMAALINRFGAEYGWQKRWSDAPSEWWHFKYAPQQDRHRNDQPISRQKHPYHVLTDEEKDRRNVLIKERRSAQKHGGWDKIDKSHLQRATEAKTWLARQAAQIKAAAAKDGANGWRKSNRKRRYDYISKLVNG